MPPYPDKRLGERSAQDILRGPVAKARINGRLRRQHRTDAGNGRGLGKGRLSARCSGEESLVESRIGVYTEDGAVALEYVCTTFIVSGFVAVARVRGAVLVFPPEAQELGHGPCSGLRCLGYSDREFARMSERIGR